MIEGLLDGLADHLNFEVNLMVVAVRLPVDRENRDGGVVLVTVGDAEGTVGVPLRSFDAFYARSLAGTLAVVVRLRGPEVAAGELTQESFLRAHRRWDELCEVDCPDLWVQRVTLNLATSQLRRLPTEARTLMRVGSRTSSPTTEAFEGVKAFWRLVRRLPPPQARVMALHYAADRSVPEVAEVLGVAEGTVKAHLHKARDRLALLLAEEAEHG